ncbi:MAG TPA: NADPH:quinone reductase [Candidatus Limnocylindria bacterium]|nr:NADPH:quinone reductase [Candidatus Limnocylindria bacterium]
MKAAFIQQPGPPESIIFGDFPKPVPAPNQVLVRVGAVAVNPIDTYVRGGLVKMNLPLPFVVGCDLAGVIEEVGAGVKQFKRSERVWSSNQGLFGRQGTFAEFAAVDEQWLHPIPANVRDEDAAALALVGITACLGLRRVQLQPGEILFVNGGTGGVGSAVVQVAKALGARVITTAGTDAKVSECRGLGADLALNYKTQDVDAAVREFAPSGVNVWWESLREPSFERTVPLLAMRGRMIVMAGREAKPVFPVGPFYVKDCALHGFAIFNAPPDEQRTCAGEINRLTAEGKLRACIDRVLPLSQTAEAHRLQEESTVGKKGTLSGKIVLKP